MDGGTVSYTAALLLLVATCACSARTRASDGSGDSAGQEAADAPCAPATLGLADATVIPSWRPPPGCTYTGGGADGTRVLVTSDAELAQHFTCAEGAASGLDFAASQLVVETRSLSPAGVGGEVVDDGRTVTYISRFRSPCPDDPMPYPMNVSVFYLLPAGQSREFAEASCTLPPDCD